MPLGAPKAPKQLGSRPWSRLLATAARWRTPERRLNLALQGGGAHGAFTWGVLDALLADPTIGFEGLSGSSAGAMNAVVLADGWVKGGRDGARQSLEDFWTALGQQMPAMAAQGEGQDMGLSPVGKLAVHWVGHFSPSQFNPLDLNPLRDLLNARIDFERLRACCPFKLFVGATQANTGRLRLFRENELTVDAMLASACLPKLHHAVDIDGEPYWDGGYCANPAVFPLFYDCDARDILLVLLNPLRRDVTPRSVQEIETRIAALAFSTHFNREMHMLAHAIAYSRARGLNWGRLERRLQRLNFHLIDTSSLASLQRTDTKLLAHTPFLLMLRQLGLERAQLWLSDQGALLGERSSVDIQQYFA